jgi:hypothetical protein
MRVPEPFSPHEERALARAVRDGSLAACPRCGGLLDEWPIPPRSDVSYVRDRLWLVCPSCRRTAVIDRRDPR